MASALPIAKLAGLLVKTLAKPVSKRIKHEFNRTATTRQLLHAIGQTSHQVTSRLTIWSAGYKVRHVTPLEAEAAMKIGSEFVGESFVLIVSVATVLWEYNRSKAKEEAKAARKVAAAAAERQALQEQLHTINVRLLALESAEIMEGHYNRSGNVNRNSLSLWNPLSLNSGTKQSTPTPAAPTEPTRIVPNTTADTSAATESTREAPVESPSPRATWWNLWGLWTTSNRDEPAPS